MFICLYIPYYPQKYLNILPIRELKKKKHVPPNNNDFQGLQYILE